MVERPATGHAGPNQAHFREEASPFTPSALDFIQQETEEYADRKEKNRPSLYSPALAEKICLRLASGETLRNICEDPAMPARASIYRWINEYPKFRDIFLCARVAGAAIMIEECIELADEASRLALDPQCGSASVAAKKLAIETRLKVAARFAPEKFGDRVRQDVAGVPGVPLESKISLAPEQLEQIQEAENVFWSR